MNRNLTRKEKDAINFQRTQSWIGNTLYFDIERTTSELHTEYMHNIMACRYDKYDLPSLGAFRSRLNKMDKLIACKLTDRGNVYYRIEPQTDHSCNWLCELGKKANAILARSK